MPLHTHKNRQPTHSTPTLMDKCIYLVSWLGMAGMFSSLRQVNISTNVSTNRTSAFYLAFHLKQ